ncbi:isopropylmalate isomerase [Roseitranquillus sediminis]|uniref:isopropylmalate isomerase n=1 Tax=Roseitranquillus sediminis TaxID=2809051 RepID=UPI001D0C597B|nr:isopropylmalate isomerase [Roseitranquillus sediminis]MBM9595173.1 isopropylmalate isomerase [Roseitranquillus sediminis]
MAEWSLVGCALGRWSPGLGDPTAMGWVTVAAYALAALLALAAAARLPENAPARRTERLFWLVSAAALAVLAVNKQLDLQSFFTAYGRCVAWAQDWYDMRRTVQAGIVLALIAASALGGALALVLLRRTLRRTGIAAAGLIVIVAFVLVRAVGFHHVDALIGLRAGGARMNWILEIGGLGIFALGALGALRSRSGRR